MAFDQNICGLRKASANLYTQTQTHVPKTVADSVPCGIFQISKKQHDLVKNMKQSGKSIQSRSLNRVLGNLDSFHVQPYEVFVEEEQKKLHQHWLVDCEGNMSFLNFIKLLIFSLLIIHTCL
jgi:hypothetical protein